MAASPQIKEGAADAAGCVEGSCKERFLRWTGLGHTYGVKVLRIDRPDGRRVLKFDGPSGRGLWWRLRRNFYKKGARLTPRVV